MAAEEPIEVTPAGFEAWKKEWLSKPGNSSKTMDSKLLKELLDKYVVYVNDLNRETANNQADIQLTPDEEKTATEDFFKARTDEIARNSGIQLDTTKYKSRNVNNNPANIAAGATREGSVRRAALTKYTGSNLVDENRDVSRGMYLTSGSDNDAANVYWEIVNKDKTGSAITEFLSTLRDYGYYGDGKPSELSTSKGGFEAKDINAIAGFLDRSNNSMLTWKAELIEMKKGPKVGSNSSGTAPVYSSREDMASYLRSAAFKNLGRALTQQEMDNAIKGIRDGQVAASGAGGVTATTLTSSSQQEVLAAAPGEAAAYGLGAALDILFKQQGA